MSSRGYGIAALQNSERAPDDATRFRDGVMRLFDRPGVSRPDDAWGALAAWAWGASRAMDYFETDPRVEKIGAGQRPLDFPSLVGAYSGPEPWVREHLAPLLAMTSNATYYRHIA
jgi:hypothetical protein